MITSNNIKQYEGKFVWVIPTGNAARHNSNKYEKVFIERVTKVFVEVKAEEDSFTTQKLRICGPSEDSLSLSKDNGNWGYIVFSSEDEVKEFLMKDRLCRKLGGMRIPEWKVLDLKDLLIIANLALKGEEI